MCAHGGLKKLTTTYSHKKYTIKFLWTMLWEEREFWVTETDNQWKTQMQEMDGNEKSPEILSKWHMNGQENWF